MHEFSVYLDHYAVGVWVGVSSAASTSAAAASSAVVEDSGGADGIGAISVKRSFGGVTFISSPSLSRLGFSFSSKVNASDKLTARNVLGSFTLLQKLATAHNASQVAKEM